MAEGRNTGGPTHAVLIALDGENAWEYYPFNGYWFLKAMYAGLAGHPQLELMTLSQCLERGIQPLPLQRLPAGQAGCKERLPPGWEMPRRIAAGTCCARRSSPSMRSLASGALDPAAQAAATRASWRCARVRTGLLVGLATIIRRRR